MAAGKLQKSGSPFLHEDEACSPCKGDEKDRRSKREATKSCHVLDGNCLFYVRVNCQDFDECLVDF